ncbi:MAG TPA: ABC transporter permease subunit [Myxococcaceae bacterium]|jgi:ABC-type transport system involved in multi-copper enzyme maturation permease subunit
MTPTVLLRQFHAEFVKARGRSLYLGSLGVVLLFAVIPLPVSIAAAYNPSLVEWAHDLASFPGCLWNTIRISHLVLPLLVAIVAAGCVGGEYSADTWKMTLPRTKVRASALLAKFLASLVLMLGGLAFALAFTTVMGLVSSRILGLPFVPGPVGLSAGAVGLLAGYFVLEFSFLISLAMLAAVLTRSLIGGALVGYLSQHLLRALTFLPGGWVSPMTNLDNLQALWVPQSHFRAADVQAALGRAVSWQSSVVTVLVFSVGFCLLSVWLFEKRDLASE